jgi:DNA-binding transcriptional LysR family regulator
MDVEIRQLKVLEAVVRCGGFSAAAREIGSTQSSVSKAILQLEHECGEPLLERLPYGVALTDAGRVVLERARVILEQRELARADLLALRGLEAGRLRIGMPPIGSGPLFAPVFAEFLRRYPRVELDLREGGGRRLEEAVQAGEVELAATMLPAPEVFGAHQVCDEPMMAVLPAQHPLAGRERLRLAELADTPCLLYTPGFVINRMITSAYARRGLKLVEAARGSQPDFMMALASAGLGVTYLPRLMLAGQARVAAALVEEPEFRWRLGLIWRREAALSPAARRFLEITRARYPLPADS